MRDQPDLSRALPPGNPSAGPAACQVVYYPAEPEPAEPALPLAHYLWILHRHRWKMLAFVLVCGVSAVVISERLTRIYESTATVDIDRRMPPGVLGQEALQAPPNDADQFLATQVRLVQSDSVLRPVAEKFQLAAAAAGPPGIRDAPIRLPDLKVTRPPNTYLLLISYRSADPQLAAAVANEIASSYIRHTYRIRISSSLSLSGFMEKQLEELKAKMERSGAALAQVERELNVINPEEKTSMLSARVLQLNAEYTSAQAERVRKEAAYHSVRTGALEAAQASAQGEPLRKVAERLADAREKFAQVKAQYGANHPQYRQAQSHLEELQSTVAATRQNIARRVEIEYGEAVSRERMLQRALSEAKTEVDRLNARSFEYQALKREAEADKKLYEELVRKIREAGINASFQNSAIRVADLARPGDRPVFPNVRLNVALALVFSTLLAAGVAVISDVLDDTIRDPELLARTVKTEVIGNLPMVKSWRRGLPPPAEGAGGGALVPARHASDRLVTGFEEAIRTLRNAILLSDFDRRLQSLLVTSASPAEGKTTVAVHLALAHAAQQHRTLLIDGDLRRPSVGRLLRLNGASKGFSEFLLHDTPWQGLVIRRDGLAHLDVLPAGAPSRRAAELTGKGLARILEEARDYDLVIMDSPPLLGLSEPLQMAALVDGVLLVALAGQTSRKAVGSAMATLARLRANVVGLVLNEVSKESGHRYYCYDHYGKYSRYYADDSAKD